MHIFCTIISLSIHLSWLIFNGMFLCLALSRISSTPTLILLCRSIMYCYWHRVRLGCLRHYQHILKYFNNNCLKETNAGLVSSRSLPGGTCVISVQHQFIWELKDSLFFLFWGAFIMVWGRVGATLVEFWGLGQDSYPVAFYVFWGWENIGG